MTDYGQGAYDTNAWIEATATFRTTGIGGMAFDGYGASDLKFAALDVIGQQVLIGHIAKGQWVVDASVGRALAPNTDYTLTLTIKGLSVSVSVNGMFALSLAFNGPVADGQLGVLSRTGTISVDSFRLKTDDPAFAGVPRVSINDVSVNEGTGTGATATLTLSLSQAATSAGTVAWSTVAGTATAGQRLHGLLGDGDLRRRCDIGPDQHPDRRRRDQRAGRAVLRRADGPVGLTIGDDDGMVTILNDDAVGTPSVTVNATDPSGAETAADPIVFTFTRSGSTTSSLAVNVAWSGSATAADYTVRSTAGHWPARSLTFAAGSATVTVTITPIDDTAVEGAETVTLSVVAGSGYVLGSPSSASGSIADNDTVAPPTVSVTSTDASGSETAPDVITFNVTRTGSTASPLAVNLTFGGTATAPTMRSRSWVARCRAPC